MKRIAIQGVPGSYHDIAAHKYFKDEDIELICCNTFEDVFGEMKRDDNVLGVIAIENTIAGSLLHNYELLRDSGATIIGEHKLRISHSIMCLPGEDWSTLTEINSHPVALAQCRDFLQHHPQICSRTLWHENPARGNRDKQTQFHPLSRGMRPMDSR